MKKIPTLLLVILLATTAHAQIEVAQLSTKGFAATSLGGFLNFGFRVNGGDAITADVGVIYFKHNDDHIDVAPMLLGYRHSFNGTGTGFYCEAGLGYTVGTTDIVKHDANGQTIYVPSSISGYDKESVQSANGLTSAVGAGYCFGGKVAINLGIQYRRVFVAGESDLNVFSFRVSHPLNFGKKKEKE